MPTDRPKLFFSACDSKLTYFLGHNVIARRLRVCINRNFNLSHNFLTKRDGAFILHICIPCDKTFHIVP